MIGRLPRPALVRCQLIYPDEVCYSPATLLLRAMAEYDDWQRRLEIRVVREHTAQLHDKTWFVVFLVVGLLVLLNRRTPGPRAGRGQQL